MRTYGDSGVIAIDTNVLVAQAVDWHEAGLGFADALHLALSKDQESFGTFDRKFICHAGNLTGRRVELP